MEIFQEQYSKPLIILLIFMSKELVKLADRAVEKLKNIDNIQCISHYDADGIASAAIVHKALSRENKNFDIKFVKDLREEKIKELEKIDKENFLFTDIGSGQINKIEEILSEKEIIVADHHEPAGDGPEAHLNPHKVDIDGSSDISGAGVTYLLMRLLNENNIDLIPFALIGAAGDIQKEEDRFLGLNKNFVKDAKERGDITVKKGLRIFGRSGKTLPRALSLTTKPFLPGITNNESGAVQFLSELGIELKNNGEWRSLGDLTYEEEKKIVNGLIRRGYDAESLLGDVHILKNGWEIGEFASLLNACGRLEKEKKGLKICLENNFDVAEKIQREYGRKIGKYLSFLENNMENEKYFKDISEAGIIRAGDKIEENFIGTITTIAIKSDIVDKEVLVGMANTEDNMIKISGRTNEEMTEKGFKINDILSKACEKCNGEGGGHKIAAGGKIPGSEEERFIKLLTELLKEKLKVK